MRMRNYEINGHQVQVVITNQDDDENIYTVIVDGTEIATVYDEEELDEIITSI